MKIDVLGIQINTETRAEIISQIETRLRQDQKTFIVTPYSESLVAAQKDHEFRDVLNSAHFALPDGIGVLWAAKYQELRIKNRESRIGALAKTLSAIIFNPSYIRHPIPEKISGSEFVWDLARLASENNYSIFLLGGFGDTPERAATALKEKFPNLKIAGTYNELSFPRKRESRESISIDSGSEAGMTENIMRVIYDSSPDFLFVALGPVTQEKWIAKHLPNLPVKLAIGLGGTFDYLAGKRALAPRFWASSGLEWLWRLITQPWRLIRILKGVFGLIYYCLKN